jgi:hypothetical protein
MTESIFIHFDNLYDVGLSYVELFQLLILQVIYRLFRYPRILKFLWWTDGNLSFSPRRCIYMYISMSLLNMIWEGNHWWVYTTIIEFRLILETWVAHPVCTHLLTAATQVQTQVSSCGIRGGPSGTGIGFLLVLRFALLILIPSNASFYSSSGAGTMGHLRLQYEGTHPKSKNNRHGLWRLD